MNLRLYVPPKYNFRYEIESYIMQAQPGKAKGRCNQYVNDHIDKYKYFLHFIYFRTVTSKKKSFNDFVEVYAADFRKLFGEVYYRQIIEFYLTKGIVECDGVFYHDYGYEKRSKAKGYRISKNFITQHPVFFQDMYVSDSLEAKVKAKIEANRSKLDKVTSNILSSLERVSIDYYGAMSATVEANNKAVEDLYSQYPGSVLVDDYDEGGYIVLIPCTDDNKLLNQVNSIIDKFRSRYTSITSIKRKEFYAVRDKTGRRVHTNLTNLAKELKRFLSVPGTDIVQIDCRNSQPFILTAVIREYHQINNEPYSPSTLHYMELVRKGEFYSFMKEALNVLDGDDDFKGRFFKSVFYCRNSVALKSPEFEVFNRHFPAVAEITLHERAVDHAKFSIRMQRIESSVCVDKALAYLYDTYESSWFSHVHDSILCDERHVDEVVNLLSVYYEQECGMEPSFRVERVVSEEPVLPQDNMEAIGEMIGISSFEYVGGNSSHEKEHSYTDSLALEYPADLIHSDSQTKNEPVCLGKEDFFNMTVEEMREYLENGAA